VTALYSFHEVARIEFDEAADYYDAEHRGLGLLFIDGVSRAVLRFVSSRSHARCRGIATARSW